MAGRIKHMERSHRSYSANHTGYGRYVKGDSGFKAFQKRNSLLDRFLSLFKHQSR